MARPKLDTLVYATILIAPLAVAIGYIAMHPTPAPVIVTVPALAPVVAPAMSADEELREAVPPTEEAPAEPGPVADDAPQPPQSPELGVALLVVERELLLSTAGEPAWAHGELEPYPANEGLVARKSVDRARLPAELEPLVDARFILYTGDGSSCTATAGDLSLYAREDGESELDYREDENGEPSPPTLGELTAAREEIFANAHLLFAELPDDGRCDGVWARRADLPAPLVYASIELDEAAQIDLKARVIAALEREPKVAEMRANYGAYVAMDDANSEGAGDTWAEFLRTSVRVSRWDELGGAQRLINVEIGDSGQGCGAYFDEEIALLFALEGERLVSQADAGFIRPLAMMDLERDGHPEAVTTAGQTIESRGPSTSHQSFSFPYNGCSC